MPTFESTYDVEKERQAAERIARAWGLEFGIWGKKSVVDIWLESNKQMVAVGEIKTAKYATFTYPEFVISLKKVAWVEYWSERFDIPAYIFAWYLDDDKIKYIDVKNIDTSRHRVIKRHNFRANNDREPIAAIPVNKLIPLVEKGE